MSTVGSQSSRYSVNSPSINGQSYSRRLSAVPYASSLAQGRFPDNRLSVPREESRPQSRTDDQSTEMITIALAKAQNAVLLDQRNNVTAALDGYSQCCAILAEVIAKETDSDDITRLKQIHDTYSVRMHVLSTMQLEPNHHMREMPPLPTEAHLQDFEDEDNEDDEEILPQLVQQPRITKNQDSPTQQDSRYPESRPLTNHNHHPSLHRTSSSRDSSTTTRLPPSARQHSHSRTSSYPKIQSKDGNLGSLEQTPIVLTPPTVRDSVKNETKLLPNMIDEEMDDAAFLERITRGFTSDEDILDEPPRPSTSSTSSSGHHQSTKQFETAPLDQASSITRTDPQDVIFPSRRTDVPTSRQTSPVARQKHELARINSSPIPSSTLPLPQYSLGKKNPMTGAAQPMLKSLSANSAVPSAEELIVQENPELPPVVPPKVKKRPHLIRVVSESTMRSSYSSRLSTFEMSPVSPRSANSVVTPGTAVSSNFPLDGPSSGKNIIVHDREGAAQPEDPPSDPYSRPYWLMRSLVLSMKNSKGAYINKRLFIPQGVWTSKSVKVKATDDKIACFNAMAIALRQVSDTDYRNMTLLLQEIGALEGTMDIIQQTLQKKLDGKASVTNAVNGDGRPMSRKMSQVFIRFSFIF